ncbi:unnamed protein product [Spirodela intermedia]|uniref:Uncharacterized protein n=1 Tax=Spirodela intermedia TaxID=51605 RepID=A0A7I8JPD3_SPIIN|nr:unnamed protein product [Spirodela intermedia]CAA6672034.1 unnamed protein product [Spirodela intermedia]
MSSSSGRRLLVSCTKQMAAHVNGGRHREALALFVQMRVSPELPASCAALRLPGPAAAVHAHAVKGGLLSGNPFVSSALVDAYAKCFFPPAISPAQRLFDELPHRNAVVWGAMIAAHARAGDVAAAARLLDLMDVPRAASAFNSVIAAHAGAGPGGAIRALALFRRMQAERVRPTLATFLALLPLFSAAAALNLVKELHSFSIRTALLPELRLGSSLVEAYGRCGSAAYARSCFDSLPEKERDVVSWSSLISAYALNGEPAAAMATFRRMAAAGVSPDGIMFLGVMKACTHAGMADEGPGGRHYACLVDAVARAGRLEEARRIIEEEMPAGRRPRRGELPLAEAAARALAEIEPENAANLVILSSVYAGAGMHEAAERVRREIHDRRLRRAPGSSWVFSSNGPPMNICLQVNG